MSIRELGPAVLQHDAAWLPIAVLRAGVQKTIIGRFSCCTKVFFNTLLIADGNLRTDGLVLRLRHDEPVLIFVTMGNILSDAAALKDMWGVKGAGGLIPCSFCVNICGTDDGEDTLLGHDGSHRIFDIRCRHPTDFVLKSSGDWYVQADTLQALEPRLSSSDFELVQKAYGMTYNQHGIIYDLNLRPLMPPVEISRYDPMHCICSNGIGQTEIDLFLKAMHNLEPPVGFDTLRTLAGATWVFLSCSGQSNKLKTDILSVSREKLFLKKKTLYLSASDTLTVIPFLRYFGERVLGAILPLEVASMSAFGAMVGVYLCGKRGFQVADELDAAILRHDVAFEAAYGGAVDEYVPKFHFTKHIPEQLRLDGFLQDCFTTERKHSLVLQAAEPVRNTRSFERSVLSRALLMHLDDTKHLRQDAFI